MCQELMFGILDGLMSDRIFNSSFQVYYFLGLQIVFLKVLIRNIGMRVCSLHIFGIFKTT